MRRNEEHLYDINLFISYKPILTYINLFKNIHTSIGVAACLFFQVLRRVFVAVCEVALPPWFVEVRVLDPQYRRLDGHQNLQERTLLLPPLGGALPRPRPEEGEADLTAVVQVWVEPHAAVPRCLEIYFWGHLGVGGRAVDVEHVAPASIRCIARPRQHRP